MAMLTGYSFDTVDGAQQMLDLVQNLIKQQSITVQDAALVTWPENRKNPQAEHLRNMTETGALGGAFWGMLFGLMFFVPFFGMAVGAAMGALTGHYSTYGINKGFIKFARDNVTVGSSALFLMTSDTVQEKVTDAVEQSSLSFKRFYTNVFDEQEKQLQQDFAV